MGRIVGRIKITFIDFERGYGEGNFVSLNEKIVSQNVQLVKTRNEIFNKNSVYLWHKLTKPWNGKEKTVDVVFLA